MARAVFFPSCHQAKTWTVYAGASWLSLWWNLLGWLKWEIKLWWKRSYLFPFQESQEWMKWGIKWYISIPHPQFPISSNPFPLSPPTIILATPNTLIILIPEMRNQIVVEEIIFVSISRIARMKSWVEAREKTGCRWWGGGARRRLGYWGRGREEKNGLLYREGNS